MKLEYFVVYKNSSDEFDIELCWIKVKVTVGLQKFPHLPQYKLSGLITLVDSYNFGKRYESYTSIKQVCSSDSNIHNL